MPQYHKLPENWGERGKFTITPRPFLRQIWPMKAMLPYHVGDRIRFCIHFECPNPNTGFLSHVVYERFEDKTKPLSDINKTNIEITGTIIDREGDVSYSVGYIANLNDLEPIFTTRVESWDTILSKWGWAIVGAIITILCGILLWLLNLIQINPHWQLFP